MYIYICIYDGGLRTCPSSAIPCPLPLIGWIQGWLTALSLPSLMGRVMHSCTTPIQSNPSNTYNPIQATGH